MKALPIFLLGAVVAGIGGCSNELPPFAQALIIVDTDMSVPRFIDRLRVDSYAADGTWFESRDYALLNGGQWPTSFSAFSTDTTHETVIILRLRAYTTGRTRDYHGERFIDTTGNIPPPANASLELPRLVLHGDATPATEPRPETAIDRLIQIVVRPEKVKSLSVVLKGDCMGTMARLSAAGSFHGLVPAEAQTCIDKPHMRSKLDVTKLEEKPAMLPASTQGTWSTKQACSADASTAKVQCVDGGAFFLGSQLEAAWDLGSLPQRIVYVSRFKIDRQEVTVGDWRAAAAAGLKSPDDSPWPLDRPLPTRDATDGFLPCSYSTMPMSREDYAVQCITWDAARAYCKKAGGDLPTEAQWEYAAGAAGREFETNYPWGNDFPDCAHGVYSRLKSQACESLGFGQQPIAAAPKDQTVLKIMNLFGGVSEWVLDTAASYSDACWEATGPRDPLCSEMGRPHVLRGTNFESEASLVSDRIGANIATYYHPSVGFRCAYPAP
jgi:formylglycine-generating enzyme required for sulfatase activity